MKAVLLVAGEGKRLAPITNTRPKHIIPIAGKPLLQQTIESIVRYARIRDFLLVVGYKKEKIMEVFGNGEDLGVHIEYIEQQQFLGTANAANYARDFVEDEPFLLMYGDLLADPVIFEDLISFYDEHPADAIITLREVDDPSNFGIIQLDDQNAVVQIVEKPAPEMNLGNLANAGIYILSSKIFDAIDRTPISPRGEYELTSSLQILIDDGAPVLGFNVGTKFWSDVGHCWQLLEASQHYMDEFFQPEVRGTIEKYVVMDGPVHVGEGTLIRAGTYIEGPVYIGKNCRIGPGAYLRPYTCLSDGCIVGNSSEIKASILLAGASVPHLSYVGDSVIGEGVNFGAGTKTANLKLDDSNVKMVVKGDRVDTGRRKLGAVVGDLTKIGINTSIMPGTTIGEHCQLGAGLILHGDIPPNSRLIKKENYDVEQTT
ncbi:MAG TPA: bifunctional sugar-1-phosphate nucleotidylyltransferase/acetyltransferase [Candidatus Lokiarchaeia archaeon]|nr:bifunctional sugar-1-phosphate nucleotidylyltransferase/acetyltransferase [Candidatus Lokiarchaeia archaeon]